MSENKYINACLLTDNVCNQIKRNKEKYRGLIQLNENNDWVETELPSPLFNKTKFLIRDFQLLPNMDSKDKLIDQKNSIKIYESLKDLPRFIMADERFWIWLNLVKCYAAARSFVHLEKVSTFENLWLQKQSARRSMMFGVLSRCYFRVALSVDESTVSGDKYELTRWVIENPVRFRELSWRNFSSIPGLVRGVLKGEKRAVDELGIEDTKLYTEIAKYISALGSVRLLDSISEEDYADIAYSKMKELLSFK